MKKSKLTLEKFQIAKLINPFKIFGGTGESALCDTDTNPPTTGDDTNNNDPITGTTNATTTNEDKTTNTTREGVSTVPTCPM